MSAPHGRGPDLTVENHGTIFLVRPVTESGHLWLAENCPAADARQYFGTALVVEPRYVADIVAGAQGDGMEVA